MKFRTWDLGGAFRLGLYVSGLAFFGASAVLAHMQQVAPATLSFLLAMALTGFAVFSDSENNSKASRDTSAEQCDEDPAHLVALLQTLAVAACLQLIALHSIPSSRISPVRRDAFVLVKLLDSMLANVGVDSKERERIKALLHRHTTLQLLLPLANRANLLIEEKEREQDNSPQGIETQKISADFLMKLESALDMYWTVIRHISDTQALSLTERARLCDEIAEGLGDLKEWVMHRRLRRPHLWLQPIDGAMTAPPSDALASEGQDA